MSLTFTPLHPTFAARASEVDLQNLKDKDILEQIREAMETYGVLVFPQQNFSPEGQLAFAERLDGAIHRKTSSRVLKKNKYGDEAITDISNVDHEGSVLQRHDRKRMNGLANRLWHTDASFEDPAGRYSMLYAKYIPEVRADTHFADLRTAYDELDNSIKEEINDLKVQHSIVYSRRTLGFEFTEEESQQMPGAVHPLVRYFPKSQRHGLYLASHAQEIIGWPIPEGRLLLRDLMEHATREAFVYAHEWSLHDLVIWDNRMTMHRATRFDDTKYRREMIRVTTLDMPHEHSIG